MATATRAEAAAGPKFPILDGLYCAVLNREQFGLTLAGGVFAANLTATMPNEDLAQCMGSLAALLGVVAANPDRARIVTSVAEIMRAKDDGVLGIIIGTQDSTFIAHDLDLLRVLQRIGVRIMQPVYNSQTELGSGLLAEPQGRLTGKGHQWVELMNELRMQIDLSHCGYETAKDVLAASRRPVIFSHSNARKLCNNPRNIPDELIRAAANTGGTVGVTLWPPLLGIERRPTLDDFADQVDYMVNLIGIDHVTFGSDLSEGTKTREKWLSLYGPKPIWPRVTGIVGDWFTYENRATEGFGSMAEAGNLVAALRKRGYGEEAIEKIMYRNLLRVYLDVWGG
jgi:membrane dipeptidase